LKTTYFYAFGLVQFASFYTILIFVIKKCVSRNKWTLRRKTVWQRKQHP